MAKSIRGWVGLGLLATALAACQTTTAERARTSFVDANVDALAGPGTAARARVATAIERRDAAVAAARATAPTTHPISHVETDPADRRFGRHTVTLRGLASEPNIADPSAAGLVKQIHLYARANRLCAGEALLMKRADDPLKTWDPATRETRVRVTCAD